MKYLNLLVLTLMLSSCESLINEVDPSRIPQASKRFVLNCYISPQDTLLAAKVHLLKLAVGSSANNYEETIVPDAKVFITEGSRSIELVFNAKEQLYLAKNGDFKILVGRTYQLKATDSKGEIHVATTTVPQPIDFDIQPVKEVRTQGNFGGPNLLSWKVPVVWTAPSRSFFRLQLKTQVEIVSIQSDGKKVKFITNEPSYNLEIKKNSADFAQKLTSEFSYFIQPDTENRKVISRSIKFLRIDENYLKYHESVNLSYRNENPFAEPSLISGNISNGYGCFGSYFQSEKSFSLK